MTKLYILTVSCGDRPGLVAQISAVLFRNGANIVEAQQYNDLEKDRFFMRIVFETRNKIAAVDTELNGIDDIRDLMIDIKAAAGTDRLPPQMASFSATFIRPDGVTASTAGTVAVRLGASR